MTSAKSVTSFQQDLAVIHSTCSPDLATIVASKDLNHCPFQDLKQRSHTAHAKPHVEIVPCRLLAHLASRLLHHIKLCFSSTLLHLVFPTITSLSRVVHIVSSNDRSMRNSVPLFSSQVAPKVTGVQNGATMWGRSWQKTDRAHAVSRAVTDVGYGGWKPAPEVAVAEREKQEHITRGELARASHSMCLIP